MPSPIGHALAGLACSFAADQRKQATRRWPYLTLTCMALAAAPDLDLLYGGHRMFTHSVAAVGVVWLATALITRGVTGRVDWRVTIACALAYGSHLLLDYFGADYGTPAGLQLFWPWHEYFKSDLELFRSTERHAPFSAFAIEMNARALAQEVLILGPPLLLAWLRRRRRSGAQPATSSADSTTVA